MKSAFSNMLYWTGHYVERLFGRFDWGGEAYQWLMRKSYELSDDE